MNDTRHTTSTQSLNSIKQPNGRTALMGAVAIVALCGFLGDGMLASVPMAHASDVVTPRDITPPSFADVVARVSPAVVSVKVKVTEDIAGEEDGPGAEQQGMPNIPKDDPLQHFFKQFGEGQTQPHAKPRAGIAQGSGFFISKDGYVVTNNHVVAHGKDIELTLQNGQVVPAKVIGTDTKTDLALLKADTGDNYPFVPWDATAPRVGDWVIAVGNPFGLGGTVTAGIVSARGRDIGSGPYDDYLQIDAPVNRGNSGGPTFNAAGQVIGINTAIYSPSGGSVGIGFDIPADLAKSVIAQLKSNGAVARGYMGVQIQPISTDIANSLGLKDTKGALVAEPEKGSPAATAGVKSGDVVTAVNGIMIDGPRDLSRDIAQMGPNKKVELTIWRGGSTQKLPVLLGSLPTDKEAKAEIASDQDGTKIKSWGLALEPSSSRAGNGTGVTIAEVDPEGLAAQNGLSKGDVIIEAAGKPATKASDVVAAVATARKADKPILLKIKTGAGIRYVALATKSLG